MVYHPPTLDIEQLRIRSHYSGLSAHRECAAKWHYRYVLRMKKPDFGPKPEMHFGSWWGALTAAEGLERGRRLGSLKADLSASVIQGPDDATKFDQNTVTVADIFADAEKWWKTRDLETREAWNERIGDALPTRLAALYDRWMDKYAEERANELPLGFEVFWKRELPRPASDAEWLGPEDGKLEGVDLIGYIDEVYFDIKRGIVVIRDKKSHKKLEQQTAIDDMMDSQLQLYAWGATPLIQTWGHGAPKAVAYDRARSVKPKSPVLTKTSGTLSKATTDYDLFTYQTWAATDTRPTDDILEWLSNVNEDGVHINAEGKPDAGVDQVEYVRTLAPGQFWGDFGGFVLSGANKGKPKFGVYAEEPKVVEGLTGETANSIWFQRTRKPLNRNIVIGHLRSAIDTATDAWRTQRRFALTNDAPRSLGKPCDYCDYAALCRARLMGGASGEYDLREFGLVAPEGKNLLVAGELKVDDRPVGAEFDMEEFYG